MRLSPGAAFIILVLAAIAAASASCPIAFSFPDVSSAQGVPVTGASHASVNNWQINGIITIDERENGKPFHVSGGEDIIVRLKETSRNESWHYAGTGSFSIVGDVAPAAYPAVHEFRVRPRGPGELSFAKIADRTGAILETFSAHVLFEEPESVRSGTHYPLSA